MSEISFLEINTHPPDLPSNNDGRNFCIQFEHDLRIAEGLTINRLLQLYARVQQATKLLFITRNSVPIFYALQGLALGRNQQLPPADVICVNKFGSVPFLPQHELYLHEVIMQNSSHTLFIDDFSTRRAGTRVALAASVPLILPTFNSQNFTTLYHTSDAAQYSLPPWGNTVLSFNQHLHLPASLMLHTEETPILQPAELDTAADLETARYIAQHMYALGKLAAQTPS